MSQPEVFEGWKMIAAALGLSERATIDAANRRRVDPLPVRKNHRGVYIARAALVAWLERHDGTYQQAQEIRELRTEVEILRATPRRSRAKSA
jgi:hypothetical protein